MEGQLKTMFPAELFLGTLNPAVMELDDLTAPDADHMVMVALATRLLKKIPFAAPRGLLDDAGLKQKRYRTVHGRPGHTLPPLLKALVQAVRIKMAVEPLCLPENPLSLIRILEPSRLEQTAEFLRSIPDTFHEMSNLQDKVLN